jgi:HD-like signal output (HDOD) protein
LPIEKVDGAAVLKKVIEFAAGCNLNRSQRVEDSDDIPEIPVLPETLLCMDLCAREQVIDLREMSQCVLGDLGATLQIMRAARDAHSTGGERFNRIEDYISALGVETCTESMAKRILSREMQPKRVREAWTHARTIAEICGELAEDTPDQTHPGEAYLVGLLHELGSLPLVLDWDAAFPDKKHPERVGLRLAEAWRLPLCVREYFRGHQAGSDTNPWMLLVGRAHALTDSSEEQFRSTEKPALRFNVEDRLQTVLV